jgi:hypothetical protein
MNNYLALHNRLQYFLVSLNEAAIYLDNLTLRLESIREFANFFRLFHTVIYIFDQCSYIICSLSKNIV